MMHGELYSRDYLFVSCEAVGCDRKRRVAVWNARNVRFCVDHQRARVRELNKIRQQRFRARVARQLEEYRRACEPISLPRERHGR